MGQRPKCCPLVRSRTGLAPARCLGTVGRTGQNGKKNWIAADWRLGDQAGAAEGFWITRPWSTAETCPPQGGQATPSGTEPITLPGQTLAIAEFVAPDAQRDVRRSARPFETVKRVAVGRFDGSRGFRLRVTGRIDRVPGFGPVRCLQPAGIEQRPICVIGVRLEEVKLEDPSTDEVLATWSVARSG